MIKNNSFQKVEYQLSGGYAVEGEITCMGAKNLATKAMVASLLADSPVTLKNIPHIGDVEITEMLLSSLGVTITWESDHILIVNPQTLSNHVASLPDSRTNRIPILLLSVLLHKMGKALVPIVGGDHIGKRNVDFHITALQKFGATISNGNGAYEAKLDKRLSSCHINLPYPSVGATETCLFLAVLAKGTSVITNIAIEPEIIELITLLRSMGAIILMTGNREVTIQGVDKLNGTEFTLIGDRIEGASWASLACASGGSILLKGVRPDLFGNFLSYYTLVGGDYKIIDHDKIYFSRKKKELSPVILETNVFPGFSTDWQQPFAVMLTQANGISVIHETVYEQRMGYAKILQSLGAKVQTAKHCLGKPCRYNGYDHDHSMLIQGATPLYAINQSISIPDVRAGLAYLIAAIIAKGDTTLTKVEQIERGYGNLKTKLAKTNVKIKRISEQ